MPCNDKNLEQGLIPRAPINYIWITLSPKEHLNSHYPVKPNYWDYADGVELVISNGHEVDYVPMSNNMSILSRLLGSEIDISNT